MEYIGLQCKVCGTHSTFWLDRSKDQHLRQCPNCSRWMTVDTAVSNTGAEFRTESLNHPPECPVSGCDVVVESAELPAHIITNHDATLE